MLRILYGWGWSSGKSRIAKSSPALFLYLRDLALQIRPPFAADSKYRVKYELGAAVIFVRFSTMGITCGKISCVRVFHVKHFICALYRQRQV